MKIVKRYIIKIGDAVLSKKLESGEFVPVTFTNRKFAEGAASVIATETKQDEPIVTVGEAVFAIR